MFSTIFIKRPRFAFVISLVIMLAGIASYFTLPVAEYPQVTPPVIVVGTFYPGASAQVIADTVAGCPVLGCLGCLALFKDHVHESVNGPDRLFAFVVFVAKTENSEHDVVEEVHKCLIVRSVERNLLVFCRIDYTYCIKYMRQSDRSVEVIAECLVNLLYKLAYFGIRGSYFRRRYS